MANKNTTLNNISRTSSTPSSRVWKIWVRTGRPVTLTATVSPILVGTAVAAYEGTFHLGIFLITLFSSLFLQIGANYFNEYFDYRYGLDSLESLGASTVIFRNEMTEAQVLAGGIGSFVIAALLGVLLIYFVGPAILLFGLAGIARAYYVQIPHWSWRAFAASVPVGFLVTAILNMNNVRDYQEDLAVHKRTLPVRFGQLFGQRYHAALLLGSYLAVSIFAIVGLLPLYSLIVWLTFPLAFKNIRAVLAATERKVFVIGTKRTALLHLQFGVVLALGIVVAALMHGRI